MNKKRIADKMSFLIFKITGSKCILFFFFRKYQHCLNLIKTVSRKHSPSCMPSPPGCFWEGPLLRWNHWNIRVRVVPFSLAGGRRSSMRLRATRLCPSGPGVIEWRLCYLKAHLILPSWPGCRVRGSS